MKESNKYVPIMAAFMLVVVIGGWFLMNKMLSVKEEQILRRTGQVAVQPVTNYVKNVSDESIESEKNQNEFMGKVLSEDEIAEVLSAWESGGKEIPHDPLNGQMNMEQAIEKGSRWIADMANAKMLPDEMLTEPFDNITAKLSALTDETEIEMQMLSMWEITYKKNDVDIFMKIHAMSGEVWMADITMDKQHAVYEECPDESLLGGAFPSFSWINRDISISLENGIYYEKGQNGNVYVALQKYDEITVASNRPFSGLCFWLGTKKPEGKN